MAVRVRLVTQETTRNFPTDLSLWVALFSLEYHIVVRAESETAAFALECRQLSTAFTLGTTGSFQVEPDSEPNTIPGARLVPCRIGWATPVGEVREERASVDQFICNTLIGLPPALRRSVNNLKVASFRKEAGVNCM